MEKEMATIDKDFCERAKNLCEKILQDELVEQSKTPVMKEFKQQINAFLSVYPLYKRYGLSNELCYQLDTKMPGPSNNKDIHYIRQLIRKLGYNEMRQNYNSHSMELVKQQLQTKFDELIKQLSPYESEQHKDLLSLYNEYKYLSKSQHPSPKELLLTYITQELNNLYIVYGNLALNIANAVVKDNKLSQLPKALKQHLTNNIKDFIRHYERHQTIKQLKHLTHIFYGNILSKYYYNNTKIEQIFDAHGCNKFVFEFSRKLKSFVQHGLFGKFKQFKAALTRKELAKEKPLMQWYDRLKVLPRTEAIMEALDNFEEFA